MTEKLYYLDAYIKDFSATVISVDKCDGGYDVVLDKTAFFPEEGGQYSDGGSISGVRVRHVYEKLGVIHHITDTALCTGEMVLGKIDFEERFLKMQIHTAEHILSGLFHSMYSLENVGFHLGKDSVTMDIGGELTHEMIERVELAANEIVYKNVPVTAYFPSKEELSVLEYRSKLELLENVRIVKIGEYDSCACCAPHVSSSGEIGVIKILDFMRHRGGTRIFITAGSAAFADYLAKSKSVAEISAMTSTPRAEISDAVAKLLSDFEVLRNKYKLAHQELYLSYAEKIANTDGNLVLYYPDAEPEDLRVVANAVLPRVSGILVLLSGAEGGFKYLIVSNSHNLKNEIAEINRNLSGRGGGKAEAVQGSFSATLDEIKDYFNA